MTALRGIADAAALQHEAVLRACSTAGLLDVLVHLTITIHTTASASTAAEVQRDRVRDEILSRADGLRR